MRLKLLNHAILLSTVLLAGCSTLSEQIKKDHQIDVEVRTIGDSEYFVGKNDQTAKLFIQYKPNLAVGLINPKYSSVGILLDQFGAIDYEADMRSAASNYLGLFDIRCRLLDGQSEKRMIQSYIFKYSCGG